MPSVLPLIHRVRAAGASTAQRPWLAVGLWLQCSLAAAQPATAPAPEPEQAAPPAQSGPVQYTPAPIPQPAPVQAPSLPADDADAEVASPPKTTFMPPAGDASTAPVGDSAAPGAGAIQADNSDQPTLITSSGGAIGDVSPSQLLPVVPKHEGGRTAAEVAQMAASTSSEVKGAHATARRASEQAADAYSLFLPRVDLKASYSRLSPVAAPTQAQLERLFGAPAGSGGGMGFDTDDLTGNNLLDRYSLSANVRIPISDYFFSLAEYYDSAQELDQVSRLQYEGTKQQIIYDAKRMFYELARATAGRRLAELRIVQLAEFTREIETLVNSGEMSSVELAQAKARQASAESALQRAVAAQNIADTTLRAHLSLMPEHPLAIGEALLETRPAPPSDFEGLVKKALRDRPEARALTMLIAANNSTRDAVSLSRLPSLGLFGSVNYDNPNQRLFPIQDRFYATWAIGAEITWSPTELATKNTELKDAQLSVVKAEQDLRGLHARIVIEVSNAYENAVAAEASIAASEVALQAAREALEARRSLFHAGSATSRQVLDAELDLRAAQLDYIDNVLSTHVAHAALEQVTAAHVQAPQSTQANP